MKSKVCLLVLIGTLAIALQLSCDRSKEGAHIEDDVERHPDVLLVTIDTARADRFLDKGLTPQIDRLAEEGIFFEQAVAPTPVTLPSHASIMTGQNPPTHGVRNNGTYRLSDDAQTLAELFKEAGYRTGAFVGAEVLSPRYGLAQGFDHYDDQVTTSKSWGSRTFRRRRAEEVVGSAISWLGEQGSSPTFVWVHLYDPHSPYDPPEPEKSRFVDAPYDGEIAYADRQIGVLLDHYRERRRWEDAVVVLTSDHGESLGEHNEATHVVFVYDATVRVPFVLRIPGSKRGVRLATPVHLIDVYPTLASAAGISVPTQVEGRDLGELIRGETSAESSDAAYIESMIPRENFGWSDLRGLRTPQWKLIVGVSPELYDLQADPDELHDLASEEPSRAQAMLDTLHSLYPMEVAGADDNRLELDAESRESLAALGYVWNEQDEQTPTAAGPLADPRLKMAEFTARMERVGPLLAEVRLDEAERELQQLLAEDPGNTEALGWLASVLVKLERYDEAIEVGCDRLVPLVPWDFRAWNRCGLTLKKAGQLDRALKAIRGAVELAPWDAFVWSGYVELLLEMDRVEDAASVLDEARDAGQETVLLHLLRAKVFLIEGRLAEVGESLSRAEARISLELRTLGPKPQDGFEPEGLRASIAQLANELGERCWKVKRFDFAEHSYRIAVAFVPDDARIYFNLGLVREQLKRTPEAIEAYRKTLELDPRLTGARKRLSALSASSG